MLYEEMCLFFAFLLMALACAGFQVWSYTFPETNVAPEHALLVDYTYYTPLGRPILRGYVSFWEGNGTVFSFDGVIPGNDMYCTIFAE